MRNSIDYRTASRKTYNKFCISHPDMDVSYNDFCSVIYSFNYAFRDYILETGNIAKLPWGFGDFSISKKKRKRAFKRDEKEQIVLPVNWLMSKSLGKKIYHMNFNTEGYVFKWKWFKRKAKLFKTDIWKFKATRVSSRLIKHYINEGYADKYQEWESLTNKN